MATSGTTTFTVTRDQIIEAALRSLAVLEEGATPGPNALENASFSLNLILKKWQSEGIKVWTIKEYILPLVPNQTSYTIGPSATYNLNAAKPLRLIQAYLRNLSNDTSSVGKISLTSGGTGYTVQPTNPVSATGGTGSGAAFNLTFTGASVTSVMLANTGGSSYTVGDVLTMAGGTFTTAATVTVDSLLSVYTDMPMTVISQQEYNMLSSKQSQGNVNTVYFKPWRDYGEVSVFLTPNTFTAENYELHLFVQTPIEDISSANQNFDFPSEWFLALKWNLAADLASDYEKTLTDKQYYEQKASMLKNELMDWDIEWSSTFFQPDARSGYGRSFR
tara:strand:- start:1311 stop:2309 length:999 start_codon:yes stop_codon:yes gene_type:complete